MKLNLCSLFFILGMLLVPQHNYAQVDFNKRPDDDLGNVEDEYQELFFEALKQKGIENYQRAVDALLKCINLKSTDAVVFYELGKNYNLLKNFGAAEDALKKAIAKEPDNEWYLDELYAVYVQQNETDKAIKTIKQLVKYHPDYKQDLVSLYIKAKKYNDALDLLDELDKSLGINDERDYLRNQIFEITGDDKNRIKHLEERLKNYPDNEINYLNLIYRYSETGKSDKAFEIAKQLLTRNPNSQLVHLALYKFYMDANDPSNAINSMKVVLTSSEINPDAKAKVLNDFVNFVSKHPEYEKDLVEVTALVGNDNSPKTLIELAQYHLKIGDKEKALSYFEDLLKEEPNNFSALKDVVLLQLDLNLDEQAAKKSEQALELYPAQPIFYLVNGVANNKLKKSKKAIQSLETGLDYIIDDTKMEADFYTQLSLAYQLDNNIAKSNAFAKKAEALNKGQHP
ncbi:tetratricopeptide repeat protein [Geojedonia litorea]|uniref:Tetratricopeptide repeat protein n=1 Tax=Geojedonia litorea TaxID=1268269 RepID=A0ABV9N8L1_9FLAO